MTLDSPRPAARWSDQFAAWPSPLRYLLLFLAVAAAHTTLLRLPYFWDEGGYYVPAALDFFHRWTLIPEFTNAHPPLPNVVLGLLWHVFGYHILVTRLTACAFAAGGLLAAFELTRRLLNASAAIAVTGLTAVYPIWFAQSSLVHADIFAAAFTLGGLALYLTAPELTGPPAGSQPIASSPRRLGFTALLFCLAVMAKETALLQPVVLAGLQLSAAFAATARERRRDHLHWCGALSTPIPLLALWFAYHRWKTGFTFGNPTFLRYNATGNLTVAHIATSLWYRFLHLFWQRNIWLPILLAAICLFLPRRANDPGRSLSVQIIRTIAALVLANWLAFSVLGGALLTRYLLPVYPLTLLVCVSIWQSRTVHWPWLAVLSGAAFVSALWLNPPTYFAPEDNLTYRDMVVVHQEAIRYLELHDPDATVLTAWPAAGELFRPELGYTDHRFKVFSIENFTLPEIARAAEQPDRFDTALVFATHYTAPALQRYLLKHADTRRGRRYAAQRDLPPAQIAALLGGRVVWQDDRNGEWAAVLRFNRSYDARRDVSVEPLGRNPHGSLCASSESAPGFAPAISGLE